MIKKEEICIKKNWKFYVTIICAIIIEIFLTTYSINIKDKLYRKIKIENSDDYIENISENSTITQTFIATNDNLEKLYIKFNPLKQQDNIGGEVSIGIKDENGNLIKEETITRNFIRENNIYKFKFPQQKKSNGKKYELYLKFNNLKNNSDFFTVSYNKNVTNEDYCLELNNKKINGTLVFSQLYKRSNKTKVYVLFNIILIFIIASICMYIYFKKDIKEEKIFLITVPLICVLFMLSMPTFKNHDELYHWIRAYEVSDGILATEVVDGAEGSILPSAVTGIMKSDFNSINYSDVKYALGIKIDNSDKYRIDPVTSSVYFFLPYIPQAIGIRIAKIFTNRPLVMAYMGRLFNIIFAMCMLYFSIKLMPFGKKIMLTLSYIPIAIEGFSSLSPDAMTISLSFFYIAYILNIAFNNKIKRIGAKEESILLITSIIISLCKIVYLPLVLLLFIIPKEKFGNKRKKVINILIIGLIATMLNLVWLKYSSGKYLSNFRDGDSKYQVMLLFKNPVEYIKKLIYTFNINGKEYLSGMLGEVLGWEERIRLGFIVPSIMFILILTEIITDETLRNKFNKKQKWVMIGTILIIVLLIFTSLYVQWTTVCSESILGVQGRYFIPILPLLMILISDKLKIKSNYNSENVTKTISITGLLTSIITILFIVIYNL